MPFTTMDEAERQTAAAFDDPQVGDRFHEMYSFWVYVVAREGDQVTTMESGAPCTFPDDARVWIGTVEELKKRFAYGTIPGYGVILEDRGNNVGGWLDMVRREP
jgi:hypothetical protein